MSIELTPLAVQNRELFAHLQAHGAPDTIADLASALRRDPSNFRKTLMALEAEGWIGRDDKGFALAVQGERALLAMDIAAGRSNAGPPPLTHDQISPDPDQPRKDFESPEAREFLAGLAESIADRGLLQPIRVRMITQTSAMIDVGESRWRAIGLLIEREDPRWPADRPIPYTLADATDPDEILIDQLVENVQRRGLHPLEEADAYARLRDAGLSVVQIAAKVAKNRRTVEQRLDLLNLTPDLKRRMRLGKDDAQHLTTARAREMLAHLRQIAEGGAVQRDIEEIAPGGVASAEDEAAARKVRLEPLELLTLGEIAAAVAEKPSTRFPDSPSPVFDLQNVERAIACNRLGKLITARFANLLIDKDQDGEPAGVRMEPLGHVRLRLDNAHPADNARALFHLRREAGFSADQARNLASLGRYVSTWLNPAAAAPAPEQAAPPAPSATPPAERFSAAVHEAAVAENRASLGDDRIMNGMLSGKTTSEGETWPASVTEALCTPWTEYPRVEIRLTVSDRGRWHVSLRTQAGGPGFSGQSSPPYVYSLDPIFRSRSDALAVAREAIIERLGEVWGRKRKLLAWLDGLDAQTDVEIEDARDELDLAAIPTRLEQAAATPVTLTQLRILREVRYAISLSGDRTIPVGRYWLDLDAVSLWKMLPEPLLQFVAPPGEGWTVALTDAGDAVLARLTDDQDSLSMELRVDGGGQYFTPWLNEDDIVAARAVPDAETPIAADAVVEEEEDHSEVLAQVREQLATGRPDFPALLQAVGLGGIFRVSGNAEVEVCFDDTCGSESVCVVDHWRERPEDLVTARALLVGWALNLAANQVQLTPPEGDDTPDRALYRAARAMQDFLLRAIPPATPLFMEVAEPYERLSIALNQAIWAGDHPKPREEPPAAPEPLLAFKPGDLVSIGGTASAYRILERGRDSGHSPSFLVQQVMLKTGKDYGEPRTITLAAIQSLVPASAVKGAGQ